MKIFCGWGGVARRTRSSDTSPSSEMVFAPGARRPRGGARQGLCEGRRRGRIGRRNGFGRLMGHYGRLIICTLRPRGLVQVETGYLFTRDSGMDSYAVPGTLARIGLGGRTELRIGHAGLIDSLTEARAAGELTRRLRVLTHPALLVVDEIGYPPVSQDGAVLFFQLINARHERASTVLTSNKGFEEWGACSATKSWPRR